MRVDATPLSKSIAPERLDASDLKLLSLEDFYQLNLNYRLQKYFELLK